MYNPYNGFIYVQGYELKTCNIQLQQTQMTFTINVKSSNIIFKTKNNRDYRKIRE